jgi:hypothetical protein
MTTKSPEQIYGNSIRAERAKEARKEADRPVIRDWWWE